MSVDNVVRHYKQNEAQRESNRVKEKEREPHTIAPLDGHRDFILRIQLSHECHYDQIHDLLEESGCTRTVITQDGVKRDLPHAMFYLRAQGSPTNQMVFEAVAEILNEHADLHPLDDLNPQIIVMIAQDVYLDLDVSKQP